jgi:hypothetical protein
VRFMEEEERRRRKDEGGEKETGACARGKEI